MCERRLGETREQMLSRLYNQSQARCALMQMRCQQAESRATKAEALVNQALRLLGVCNPEAAVELQAEYAAEI